jgi:polysaccharide export outer membrane protein
MSAGSSTAVLQDIQALFDSGTASGLSDRQLLDRLKNGSRASAEGAFEVLVLRHGPMVLQVCSNVLGNAADAQDAFQATFLVLVRRSSSIKSLESVGGWLYGVACRVAARARVEAARRRAVERRGGLRVVEAPDSEDANDPSHAESSLALQAEVKRLPEKYRSVVVLCYWQGLTQEQAAAQLGCPLGTVRSRLARARGILHRRLVRRGLAPLAAIVAAALGESSASACTRALLRAPVHCDLAHSTASAAAKLASGEAVAQVASGAVTSLVQHVLWSLMMIRITRFLTACLCVAMAVTGASLWAQQPRQKRARPLPAAQPDRSAQPKREAPGNRKFGPAHVVEPPDLLLVEVLEALPGRPISGERLVRPDGSISLGFYGDVQVGGLTLPEIKERIVRHLQKYLSNEVLGLTVTDPESGEPVIDPSTGKPRTREPKDTNTVCVDVTAYNSQNYYVQGDVLIPGRMPFTGNETVLDVINFAGGLLPTADRAHVKLIRSYPKGSPIEVLPVDYEEVTMGTDASTNYTMMPNDRLVVPRDPACDSQPSSGSSGRSSQPRARQMVADSRYFPSTSVDTDDQQLSSLRAVERHLSEVEKKLDRVIEWLERTEKTREAGASDKAVKAPAGAPSAPPETSPFSMEDEKPASRRKPRRPRDTGPE